MPLEGNIKKAVSQNVANDVPLNDKISQTRKSNLIQRCRKLLMNILALTKRVPGLVLLDFIILALLANAPILSSLVDCDPG